MGGGGGGLAKEGPLSAPARERTITLITRKHFSRRRSNQQLEGILCCSPLMSGRRRVAQVKTENKTRQRPNKKLNVEIKRIYVYKKKKQTSFPGIGPLTTYLHHRPTARSETLKDSNRSALAPPQRVFFRPTKSARPFISSSAHILREPLEAARLAPRSMIPFFFFSFFRPPPPAAPPWLFVSEPQDSHT